jgi:sec-independent protein translocase protein TatB
VKADINREVELEELRKMRDTVQQAASGIENSVQAELHKTESELNAAANAAATADASTSTAASTPAPAAEAPKIPEKTG